MKPTLTAILSAINLHPARIPTLNEFAISDTDKKDYLKLVDTSIEKKEYGFSINPDEKAYYYTVPTALNRIKEDTFKKALNEDEKGWSTESYIFEIKFINTNNDTLHVNRTYYWEFSTWNIPWQFTYNSINFPVYDVNFSRYINDCLPSEFRNKQTFENKYLLLKIAQKLKE